MPLPTGDSPGFDDPVGLLLACHERILSHCEMLERVVARVADNDPDDETKAAAQQVVAYFSTAGKLHHEDEETDLFPRLIRQSLKIADLLHALKLQHREIDRLWQMLEPQLRQLDAATDADALRGLAAAFCDLQREHVRRENREFLPLARHSLSNKILREIGAAMAERRGVKP